MLILFATCSRLFFNLDPFQNQLVGGCSSLWGFEPFLQKKLSDVYVCLIRNGIRIETLTIRKQNQNQKT